MADVVGTGVVTITGDTSQLVSSMDGAASSASKAAGATGASWQAQFAKIGSAGAAMSSQLGGRFQQLAGLANSALRPVVELGAALGPIGLGATAAGAALTGFAIGAVKLTNAAVDARHRLHELGEELRGPELSQYEHATSELREAADQLTVTLGERLAPALSGVVEWLTAGVRSATDLAGGFDAVGVAVDATRQKLEESQSAFSQPDLAGAFGSDAAQIQAALNAIDPRSIGRSADEMQRLAAATALAQQARVDWYRTVAEQSAATATAETESAERARYAMLAANEAVLQSRRELAAEVDELRVAAEAAEVARAKADEQRMVAATQLLGSYTEQALGSISSILDLQLASWETMRQAGEQLTEGQARAANTALDAATAVAVAQAGVSAALTTIGALASMSALLIPPWVAVPLAVSLGATSYAATVAGIYARQPARFTWQAGTAGAIDPDSDDDGTADVVEAKGGEVTPRSGPGRPNGPGGGSGGGAGSGGGSSSLARTAQGGVTVEVMVRSGLPGRSGRGTI